MESMELDRKTKLQLRTQHWLFVLLLLVLAVLAGAVTRSYHKSWDVTLNGRNSLSEGGIAQLRKLKTPVEVTVYAGASTRIGDAVKAFFAPYQRLKPDLKIRFIDPDEQPTLARDAGIQQPGEAVVQIGKRSDHLRSYNEAVFINLLARLARDQDRLVMYLDGHGERKLEGEANFDYGQFGRQLASRGFQSAPLNLALAQEVPNNVSVLVLSSPRVDLLPAEQAKLKHYVERGGNLLWLVEPAPLHGLQPLSEQLGIVLSPGTIIDPQAQQKNVDPTIAIGAAYAEHHPLLQNFNLLTVFPLAREVTAQEDGSDWRATQLIQVAARGWVETGALDQPLAFNQGRDKQGPLNIAVALERTVNDRTQRAVVIGNENFLSNQYIGNGGNLDLGINSINWLAGDENQIAIQARATRDAQILLSDNTKLGMVIVFALLLPLGLLGAGIWVWWRRRKS